MSGYPYGNPNSGYPPNYGSGNPPYPTQIGFTMPPPLPVYSSNPPPIPVYSNPPVVPLNISPMSNAGPYSASAYGGYPGQTHFSDYAGSTPNYLSSTGFTPPPPAPVPTQSYSAGYDSSYSSVTPAASSTRIYPSLSSNPIPSEYSTGGMNSSSNVMPHPQTFYPQQQQQQQPITSATVEQYQGTVFPSPNFDAEADCYALSNAMKGAGTNERVLIDIIANRSNVQRQQIKIRFKTMFGQDLIKKLGGELSGNFRETMTALFDSPADYDAWSLNQAINGGKEGTLREILLTRTNSELRAINDAYRRLFHKELDKDIENRVSGNDFKRMLISAVQAQRDELTPSQIEQSRRAGLESVIDRNRARQDAEALYKAGEARWGTNEKAFNAIFSQRSYYQLRATFEEYRNKYGKDIAAVIRSEFSGDAEEAYLVLISCIRDRPIFFAERLKNSMVGLGTRDSTLIRVIITRSEIDLAQIKERYQQLYRRSLVDDIRGDTSGDYKRILLALVK